jgi:hypothetical protein
VGIIGFRIAPAIVAEVVNDEGIYSNPDALPIGY